ncbi:MAG: hypothetical protein IKT72_01230, partial [Clostridia bacterium]|nr:hypothetical protein [Clostridia bacterium]
PYGWIYSDTGRDRKQILGEVDFHLALYLCLLNTENLRKKRLPCVKGAPPKAVRDCFLLKSNFYNPSVIFLRKCHLPLHKGGFYSLLDM